MTAQRKHRLTLCLLAVVSAAVMPRAASGVDFSFKLSGSYSYLKLDAVNQAIQGWSDYKRKEAAVTPGWNLESGGVKQLRGAVGLEGELVAAVLSRLALGVSYGYVYGELSEEDTSLYIKKGINIQISAYPAKVTAYPLVLSAYYFQPVGKKIQLYLRAGGGRLRARYVNREAQKLTTSVTYTYPAFQIATGRGTISQGGLGIKYALNDGLEFFLEAGYRRAEATGFDGENREGVKGKLYAYEEYRSEFDYWQPQMKILPAPPAGDAIRLPSEAVIDFSGAAVHLGVFIKF